MRLPAPGTGRGPEPERRVTRRRSLPYVRSAVLELGDRNHIVAVSDLSPEGAFLSTRLVAAPGTPARLRIVLPRHGRELRLECEIVRRNERQEPGGARAIGLAVRFRALEGAVMRRIEEFARDGFMPAARETPLEHFEYRVVDRSEVDPAEMNRLGLDGWRLAAAVSRQSGVRLIFLRSL